MHPKVEKLKEIKEMLHITNAEVSKATNITHQTISNVFSGKCEPKIGVYFEVEDFFKNELKKELNNDTNR